MLRCDINKNVNSARLVSAEVWCFPAARLKPRTFPMVATFESVQHYGKEQLEAFTAASDAIAKGWQGIATETTDYSKKSFEKTRELAEKLIGVKKLDEAIALQSEFAKTSYEEFVAESTKIGELYTALAKEVFKPLEMASKAFTPSA
jgi:hypothetical protein